jgi:NAD(P)-dependent dehydrogenase (short-subunit alcohol dehydrogenase family)
MLSNLQSRNAVAESLGRLNARVALIVGGGSGIGEATARMFAREGARVSIGDINYLAARSVADSIVTSGGDAIAIEVDVRSDASVKQLVSSTIDKFGKLHILFNSAGGSLPQDAPVTDVDMSVWDHTMSLDLLGTILCCRHAMPQIIANGGGAVVNMSSGAALRGSGRAHIYASAKGAILSLTQALAGTYAKDNVRANAICSGRINTERIRQSYGIPGHPGSSVDAMRVDDLIKEYPFWFGEPEDIANIALFLASDESRMITGVSIPADGGRSAY